MIEIQDNGPEARKVTEEADRSVYRSIYLPLMRGVTPSSLEAFDPVTQTLVTGQRDATTVPTQALFLLNSAFVRRQSLALADNALSHSQGGDMGRIRQTYLLTLGRAPSKQELTRDAAFLKQYASSYRELPAGPAAVVKPSAVTAKGASADTDDVEHAGQSAPQEIVQPKSPKEAAWMSLTQSLYASAEFRFVR
jgi:hypothetical protein